MPGEKHAVDEDLLAFCDRDGHVGACGVGRLDLLLDLRAGLVEAVADVVAEHGVAISGERDQREGLALLRAQQRFHLMLAWRAGSTPLTVTAPNFCCGPSSTVRVTVDVGHL